MSPLQPFAQITARGSGLQRLPKVARFGALKLEADVVLQVEIGGELEESVEWTMSYDAPLFPELLDGLDPREIHLLQVGRRYLAVHFLQT